MNIKSKLKKSFAILLSFVCIFQMSGMNSIAGINSASSGEATKENSKEEQKIKDYQEILEDNEVTFDEVKYFIDNYQDGVLDKKMLELAVIYSIKNSYSRVAELVEGWPIKGIETNPYYEYSTPETLLLDIYGEEISFDENTGELIISVTRKPKTMLGGVSKSATQITLDTVNTGVSLSYYGVYAPPHYLTDGTIALCSEHFKPSIPRGSTLSKASVSSSVINDSIIRKIIYYGYGGPKGNSLPLNTNAGKASYMQTTLALSYRRAYIEKGKSENYGNSQINNLIRSYIVELSNNSKYPEPKSSFGVTFWNFGNSYQQLATWYLDETTPPKDEPTPYVNLKFNKIADLTDRPIGQGAGSNYGAFDVYEYNKDTKSYLYCTSLHYNGDTAANRNNNNIWSLNNSINKTQYGANGVKDSELSEDNTRLKRTKYNEGKFCVIEKTTPIGYSYITTKDGNRGKWYFDADDYLGGGSSAVVVLSDDWTNNQKVNNGNNYINIKFKKVGSDGAELNNAAFIIEENVAAPGTTVDKWQKVVDVVYNADESAYVLSHKKQSVYHGTQASNGAFPVVATIPGYSEEEAKKHLYLSSRLYYTEYNRGRFRLVETSAPDGYQKINPIKFEIYDEAEPSSTYLFGGTSLSNPGKIEDKVISVPYLYVTKTDLYTGDNLAGATFEIRKDNAGTPDYNGEALATFTTVDGTLEYSYPLSTFGIGTFWVVETNAPDGYEVADPISFAVTDLAATASDKYVDVKDKPEKILNTVALDSVTQTHSGIESDTVNIEDTVSYGNLDPSTTYTFKGKLINKSTGKVVCYEDGSEIVVTNTITTSSEASECSGSFVMTYDNIPYEKVEDEAIVVVCDVYDDSDNLVISHNDLNNEDQTVCYPCVDSLVNNGGHLGHVVENETVNDNLYISNLVEGEQYVIYSKLYNKTDDCFVKNSYNEDLEIYSDPFVYTPTAGSMDFNNTITFDATNLGGKTIVIYDYLVSVDGANALVYAHDDPNDLDQTIYFPTMESTALDKTTGNHVGAYSDNTVFEDSVTISNLVKSESSTEFTVTSWLVDLYSEDIITDKDGKECKKTKTISVYDNTPKTINETFTYNLNSINLDGTSVVAYAKVEDSNGNLVYEHAELSNKDQTVLYPSISTKAISKATNKQVGIIQENEILKDYLYINGLTKDETYTIKGKLVDSETEEDIKYNGSSVEITQDFVANGSFNEVELEYTFNSTEYKGKTIVVYEAVYDSNGNLLYSEEDPTNIDQMVQYPSVSTTATDNDTAEHIGSYGTSVKIKDVVTMNNLYVGYAYHIVGTLMDKETGKELKDVNGNAYTAEAVLNSTTNPSSKYTSTLYFDVDTTSLEGKDIVVFEKVYVLPDINNTTDYTDQILIGSHEDINDDGQTVSFVKLRTTATDKNTENHVGSYGKTTTVKDKVTYENLIIGKTYKVSGRLINKETGDDLVNADGNYITAEKEFTPTKSSGYVELEFTVDSTVLQNKTIVAFEEMYYDSILIGIHADIDDEDQTIYYPEIGTKALDIQTEDHISAYNENASYVDTVSYKNLVPGNTYKVKGVLMNAKTKTPITIDGKKITGETEFTPNSDSGTVKVTFTLNATKIKGTKTVVFETLYYEDIEIATHEDINDEDQTIEVPDAKTNASDKNTETSLGTVDKEITLIDEVSYEHLIPNKEYTVKGVLMNKETGEKLLVDGKEVTAEKKFTPDSADGIVELEFTLNSNSLKGEAVVVFEDIYYKEIKVATHSDIDDEDQTITFPDLHTTALDNDTNTHTGLVSETQTIVDEVKYENLIVGKTYKISGKLINKNTEEPLLDKDGNEIVAEKEFKAETSNGSVTLTYTLDSSLLAGEAVVVFEDLYYNNKKVISHADITDEDQTIYYPDIQTTALNSETNDHIASYSKETVYIDTVEYTNLIVGKKYTVKGVLMDADTNKAIEIDGEKITSEETFVPSSTNGTVEVKFKFDATKLYGTKTVVFEDLYYDGIKLTSHADINDENQTIEIAETHTSARDSETNSNVSSTKDSVTIIDRVVYSHLIPNKEYTVKGVLMNKDTKEKLLVNDKEITATKTFTAKDSSGYVELEFTFNAENLKGVTTVVFEDIYYNDIKIATHANINDEDQTIYFPEIGTTAVDTSTNNHQGVISEKTIIEDEVVYSNLVPNKEYTIKGVLMNKDTNKAIVDEDGNKITAETTFTPTSSKGSVVLTYTLNSELLKGETVVVFEDLYHNDINITSHADIDDEDQSVYYPEIGTTAADYQTKDNVGTIDKEAQIIDTVEYKNLIPDQTYVVKGILMNRDTNEPLLNENGEEITSEKTFVAAKANDSIEVIFTLDSNIFKNTSIVVFEKLYYEDVNITNHEDIEDTNQTIYYPEIKTNASDDLTKSHVGSLGETQTITDIVEYSNLIVGKEYTVKGVLMNKDTEKAIIDADGNEITAETVFIPDEANGSVELVYTVDSTLLRGETAVVFEDLYHNNINVTSHADIEDENQTIYFPNIQTTALCDGEHNIIKNKTVTVIDTVKYENLVVGKTYKVSGVLMNKETKAEMTIDGKPITGETEFTPEKTSGSVEVEFVFDSSKVNGNSLVVFEELYDVETDTLIGDHKDIDDEDQTVTIDIPNEPPVTPPTTTKEPPTTTKTPPATPPKTGDVNNITKVLGIMILAGFVVILFMKKRKTEK